MMTSPTLMSLLRAAVSGLFPSVAVDGRDKTEILADVMAEHGWAALLGVGAELRRMADHPVVRGVVASPHPGAVLERWSLLERFGHSSNRVERLGGGDAHVVVRHVAADGATIAKVNDLFVWGVLLSLFELAGASQLTASFGDGTGDAHGFHPAPDSHALPAATHTVTFRWQPGALASLPIPDGASVRERLHALVRRDPLVSWTIERAATELSSSGRTLQRAIRAEGTTFSATVQRARVACAEALLGDARLSLTEIAFCSGFADQAHFTRTFRKFLDIPPSALRDTTMQRRDL